MIELINLIGKEWGTIDKRVWDHKGSIVDLGCLKWDWSEPFLGKKDVVGVDPIENTIPSGARLFKGVVSDCSGLIKMKFDGESSSSSTIGNDTVESITFEGLLKLFDISRISILKINIEGGEYSLLINMNENYFNIIDQIAVSFHDWRGGYTRIQTYTILGYLSHWYQIIPICRSFGWFLLLRGQT